VVGCGQVCFTLAISGRRRSGVRLREYREAVSVLGLSRFKLNAVYKICRFSTVRETYGDYLFASKRGMSVGLISFKVMATASPSFSGCGASRNTERALPWMNSRSVASESYEIPATMRQATYRHADSSAASCRPVVREDLARFAFHRGAVLALGQEMAAERIEPRRDRTNPRVVRRKMSKFAKKRPSHRGRPP